MLTGMPATDDPAVDEHGRTDPPAQGDELETLTGFLEFQRATFGWKTDGLDAEQLGRTIGDSTMTLAGMIKHLALVEDSWLSHRMAGRPEPEPWASVDWDADPDWEWHSATDDSPEELCELWAAAVDRSRTVVEQAAAAGGPGRLAERATPSGTQPSLRWILTHLIEEYARHNGHADLIRETIDGQTGE